MGHWIFVGFCLSIGIMLAPFVFIGVGKLLIWMVMGFGWLCAGKEGRAEVYRKYPRL